MSETNAAALPRSATLTRIPSLDGLRAVSIFLVVCLHSLQTYSASHHVSGIWYGIFNGGSGVFIFFEISGFLITTLLLAEHQKRGSISLRGFYLRRAFRILPPLYLYIAVAALLGVAGRLALSWGSVFSALFFFHNVYAPGQMWSIEHLWSISVEEQFYLVWPFVLVYCMRRRGRSGRLAAAVMPAAVIVMSPVLRVVLAMSHQTELHRLGISFLKFDFIMYGCLIALLQGMSGFERVYGRLTRWWWLMPAVIVGCNLLSARYENSFDLTIGYTISGAAIAIFLLWCTRNAASVIGRMLNARPVAWVGVLSYSIYLWQTLWLHDGNQRVFAPLGWLTRFPLNWLGFMAAAMFSYYLVEQPSLRLRGEMVRRLKVYRGRRG